MEELAMMTKSSILETTSAQFEYLRSKWAEVFNSEYCAELLKQLEERVKKFFEDLLQELNEKTKLMKDAIWTLQVEASEMKHLLHRSVYMEEKPDEMPLIVWQEKLEESIEHLREELLERRAEVRELLLQQEQLCEELGELPIPLLADPLPKPQEMLALSEHLSRLRAEQGRRMEELIQLRAEKDISELFASRTQIWSRMEALEAKGTDPTRFNNRGAQLLKEERERSAIGWKLPKIEQQITELAKAYELRTGSPFLVHGQNILEYMASDWVRLREAKEQQSSARKQAILTPTATSPGPLSRTPLSAMSLRRTPSDSQLHSAANSAAKTTGYFKKRKRNNNKGETSQARRSLMKTWIAIKSSAVRKQSPAVGVMKDAMRRSSGLGRRSMGQSAKKQRFKIPIPEICVKTPSDEENDGFITDDGI